MGIEKPSILTSTFSFLCRKLLNVVAKIVCILQGLGHTDVSKKKLKGSWKNWSSNLVRHFVVWFLNPRHPNTFSEGIDLEPQKTYSSDVL